MSRDHKVRRFLTNHKGAQGSTQLLHEMIYRCGSTYKLSCMVMIQHMSYMVHMASLIWLGFDDEMMVRLGKDET